MDAFLDRRSKPKLSVLNWVGIAVHISLRVAYWSGSWDTEGEGGGSRKQSNGGMGFKDKT